MKHAIVVIGLMCAVLTSAGRAEADSAAPLTLDDLFGGAQVLDATVSPDAHFLALIIHDGDHAYVAIKDLNAAGAAKPVLQADSSQRIEPRWCEWAGATHLICQLSGMARSGGSVVSRMVLMDADGGNRRILTHKFGPAASDFDRYNFRILDFMPEDPDTILIVEGHDRHIAITDRAQAYPGVARYSLSTGALHHVLDSSLYMSALFSDGNGEVRMRAGVRDSLGESGHAFAVQGMPAGQSEWKDLKRVAPYTSLSTWAGGCVVRGTNDGYLLFAHDGHRALWTIDLADEHDPELAFADARRDINGLVLGSDHHLLGVTLAGRVGGPVYLDARAKELANELDRALPGRWHFIRASTPDLKVAVVKSWGAAKAGEWYVLDNRGSSAKLGKIGESVPGLRNRTLNAIQTTDYIAADGQTLNMDYMVPASTDPGVAPPLLVWLVPGADPTGADRTGSLTIESDSGFSYAAQYFSARGYAIAMPQLRVDNATQERWRFPFADWGGAVHDDVISATRSALAATHADPKRVCFIGENYAGYTALVAALRQVIPMRCVAAINGVSDLSELRTRAKLSGAYLSVGQRPTGNDLAMDEPFAPRRHAADFAAPVLLIHSDLTLDREEFIDTDADQSKDMSAALERAHKQHRLLLSRNVDYAYRREVLGAIDQFLAQYNPTGSAPR